MILLDIQQEKALLRAEALARRKALPSRERERLSLAVCRALEGLEELRDGKTVFGYVPSGSECDLRPFYETLRRKGVTLAFPVTLSGGEMEAYVPGGAFIAGSLGIPEPDPTRSRLLSPEELDAVLVPCVAFDAQLRRLGHGKGYYDRYLARCPRAAAILTAFEAQRLPNVPCEAHDLFCSILVTEAGVVRK